MTARSLLLSTTATARHVFHRAFCSQNPTTNKRLSFIERVRVFGANALLGAFLHKGGFDRVLEGLVVEKISQGSVQCRFVVKPEVQVRDIPFSDSADA